MSLLVSAKMRMKEINVDVYSYVPIAQESSYVLVPSRLTWLLKITPHCKLDHFDGPSTWNQAFLEKESELYQY